jgi:hypothetical protein
VAASEDRPRLQVHLAISLAHGQDHTRAAEVGKEALKATGLAAGDYYDLACAFALASAAAGRDSKHGAVEANAKQAVALLARARQGGFFRRPGAVEHLRRDPDLACLRAREDFRGLLKEIESAGP